ncbi:MAG: HlyD family efflux transporter periplasmic adaptor subunit [Candidatus Moraniibacteriota bacterium]|nr:MAG: HlyD family efflux transporter periplasmic adaptor subunit [Candidatus Moranbacteria bacterium]
MSQSTNRSIKTLVVNGLYLGAAFLFAFMIATQALMHKINNYELNKSLIFLTVKKERVDVSTTVAGRIEEILVRQGSSVKEGEIVARLKDEGRVLKIAALRPVAGANLSARTELELLLAQEDEFEIRAPRSGVVEKVHSTKGTSVIEGSVLLTVYANDDLELVGTIRPEQYNLIDKHRSISVFNPRLGQAFTASFQGITGVRDDLLPDGTIAPVQNDAVKKNEMYEIRFSLNEKEEGGSFIEGEKLEVISENADVEQLKPLYRLARMWNSLILGTDFDALRKYNEGNNNDIPKTEESQ